MSELRKLLLCKNLIPAIGLAIFLVVLSIGAGFYFLGSDTMQYLFWCSDIKEMRGLDFEDEKFVKFEADDILGVYADYDEGEAYVIEYEDDDGNTQYIGMYYAGKNQRRPVEFAKKGRGKFVERGMLYSMSSLEETYYREFFAESGFSDKEINGLGNYYIVCIPFSDVIDAYFVGGVIIMLALVIGAIVIIIKAIGNSKFKELTRFVSEHDITENEFSDDVLAGETYADVMLGSKYAISIKGFDNIIIVDYAVITNMHSEMHTQNTNNGSVTCYWVAIVQDNGLVKKIKVDGAKAASELMLRIQAKAPHIIIDGQ